MPDVMALLIDEQAASIRLDDAMLRDWGADTRVFVSSLIADMPEERAAVRDAIIRVGARPVMFEHELGGQDVGAEQAYLAGVRSSDIYVGILGPRYGVPMPGGYSATHAEYQEAVDSGRRLAVFVSSDQSRPFDGQQQDLIGGIRNFIVTGSYDSPETLGQRVESRLREIASQSLAPWVQVDTTVFRATTIEADSRQIVIEADVRNREIINRLNLHRDRQSGDLLVALPHQALVAQMSNVAARTTAVNRTLLTITLSIRDSRSQNSIRFGAINYGGETITAAEQGKRALQDSLFGTSTLPNSGWGRSSTISPLAPLLGRHLDDPALRPVAELLLSDWLLRRKEAATVGQFHLGPNVQGSRRLSVTWTPPRQYDKVPAPESLHIEGTVSGL